MVLLACLLAAGGATAHEIQASIVDLFVENGRLRIELVTNAEARLAGIGAEHEDTRDAPEAATYDRLRGLAPEALTERLRASDIARRIEVATAGGEVPLAIASVDVPSADDPALARQTRLVLEGTLPPGVRAMTIAAPGFGDLVLRGTGANATYSEFLRDGTRSQAIRVEGATARGFGEVFAQYLVVGFEHIVPLGLDHILFVIGLFLFAPRVRALLWQVSAFTLAHTATLALGALDVVRVSGSIVEPLIALSIVYVAVENVFAPRGPHAGGVAWRRVVLVFAFGLLHGLGFASVFEEYGIPEGQFVAALLAFNIGVEGGQIAVLGLCFLLAWPFARSARTWRLASVAGSIAIGAIGLFWALERTGIIG